jgi:hypothetical protein
MINEPNTIEIAERRPYQLELVQWALPAGCWESPVWENGIRIGTWLNYQFDPNDCESNWDIPQNRFKPVGSNEWVEEPGQNSKRKVEDATSRRNIKNEDAHNIDSKGFSAMEG